MIVVSTPSRAKLHIEKGNLTLLPSLFQTFVVDEADLVLSYGHAEDMQKIAAHMPGGGGVTTSKVSAGQLSGGGCQSILMSATLSTQLEDLKRLVLHSPAIIRLRDSEGASGKDNLLQFYVAVNPDDKYLLL